MALLMASWEMNEDSPFPWISKSAICKTHQHTRWHAALRKASGYSIMYHHGSHVSPLRHTCQMSRCLQPWWHHPQLQRETEWTEKNMYRYYMIDLNVLFICQVSKVGIKCLVCLLHLWYNIKLRNCTIPTCTDMISFCQKPYTLHG